MEDRMIRVNSLDQAKTTDATASGHFQGRVRIQRLVSAPDDGEIEVLAVYFSRGARTKPHVHDVDQVLHIVRGRGIVSSETERRFVQAGDVVTIGRGTWHWHGATRDCPMMHLSIKRTGAVHWDVDLKDWADF